jgi:tetratricopeptide (TPR) repeat protein
LADAEEHFESFRNKGLEFFPKNIASYKTRYSWIMGYGALKKDQIETAKSDLSALKASLLETRKTDPDLAACLSNSLEGEILLAEGAVDKAVAVAEEAFQAWFRIRSKGTNVLLSSWPLQRDLLARAYERKGETGKAIETYLHLITEKPYREDPLFIYPGHYYDLARLCEKNGLHPDAKKYYQRFLELWTNADPGRPEVVDAKKRLALLKD